MTNFIIGFLVAVLSGLGIGGGGLLVIWLVMARGTEQLSAQGINLVWFLFSSGAAMLVHLVRRRLNFKLIAFLIFFGTAGAAVGSSLAKNVPTEFVRSVFGWLLIGSGILTVIKKRR